MRFKTLIAMVLTMLVATAAPAVADDHEADIRLLTRRTPAVTAGESLWLTFNWTSRGHEVTQFSATATASQGATVEYPQNTPGYTGLMDGHVLSTGEVDYTAVKLTIPYDAWAFVTVTFEVTYHDGDEERTERFRAWVPVRRFSGDVEVTQLDASASVESGSGTWVGVDFTTKAPRADNFSMTVVDDAGLAVSYPSGGDSTSLHYDARLSQNETDTARFYVDTEGMDPGVYELELESTYEIDGEEEVLDGSVTVTVTG